MRFDLTILGCNSAIPAAGRHPSAQVLTVQNQSYLIDCGEGTQMRMMDFKINKNKINQIFISHLHGDHYLGIIGLLNSLNLSGRTESMTIFSPFGLEEIVDAHRKYGDGNIRYPVNFVVVDTTAYNQIFENEDLEVFSIPLQHRIPTTGYLFKEKKHPLNIISEKIEEYQISIEQIKSIKRGEDLLLDNGKIVPNKELVKEKHKRRSYAYCSDTIYDESIVGYLQNVDLLYHEATYGEDCKELAVDHMHTTAKEAAQIAKKANADKLIIGHFSSRYREIDILLTEAQSIFPNSIAAKEGERYMYNK